MIKKRKQKDKESENQKKEKARDRQTDIKSYSDRDRFTMERKGSGWGEVGCHTCNPCTQEREGDGEMRSSTKTPFRLNLHCVATETILAYRTQRAV